MRQVVEGMRFVITISQTCKISVSLEIWHLRLAARQIRCRSVSHDSRANPSYFFRKSTDRFYSLVLMWVCVVIFLAAILDTKLFKVKPKSRDVIWCRGQGGILPPDFENSDFFVFLHTIFLFIFPPPLGSWSKLCPPWKKLKWRHCWNLIESTTNSILRKQHLIGSYRQELTLSPPPPP